MLYFWQGFSVGLAYSAPLGLQNLFIINSTLSCRLRRALLTALIVLFFDAALSLACFFGIGAVMQRWFWLQMLVLLVGGLIVGFIGLRLLRSQPPDIALTAEPPSIRQTVATACVVTWFNPQALIDGTMMLGAFQVSLPPGRGLVFIQGVVLASLCWFVVLTLLVSCLRAKFNAKVLHIINLVCGAVIIFYAGKLLLNFGQLLGNFIGSGNMM